MLTQALHQNNAVLGAAMQGLSARNDAIINNIANNDVPAFTARRVEFEGALEQAINNWRRTGTLNLSGARATIHHQEGSTVFRMDGNNVDIEREMVSLWSNSTRADVMVNAILHNSRALNAVLQGR